VRVAGTASCRRAAGVPADGVAAGDVPADGVAAGVAARRRARWAATWDRVAHRSQQNRRQLFDEVSR